MPPTRTDPLEHVLLNVLGAANAKHPLHLAMNAAAVVSIDDLMDLTKPDLQSISWVDDSGNDATLGIAQVNAILSIRSWFQTQTDQDDDVFLTLTKNGLRDHCRALAAMPSTGPTIAAAAAATPSGTAPAPAIAPSTLSAADEFKKGIK